MLRHCCLVCFTSVTGNTFGSQVVVNMKLKPVAAVNPSLRLTSKQLSKKPKVGPQLSAENFAKCEFLFDSKPESARWAAVWNGTF